MQSVRPKENKQSFKVVKQYSGKYKTATEYSDALRVWMSQLYQLQCIHSSFPFFLASLQAQSSQSAVGNANSSSIPTTRQQTPVNQRNQQQTPTVGLAQTQQRQEAPRQGTEYSLPPIWKRFVAEMIDFLLLFIIKLGVTYVAVDTFNLLEEVEKYDLESLSTDILTDYKAALSMTSDILFLELIHRIGTCVFEALCLHRGPLGQGGATPGKRVMGLRVVRCEFAAPALGDRVVVYPSNDLGLGRAVVRSVVKNFSMTFLFPICVTLFSFHHNRTIYDVIAGSIVVEERSRRRQEPNNNNNN